MDTFIRHGFQDVLVSLQCTCNPLCSSLMNKLHEAFIHSDSTYSSLLSKNEEYIWEEIHSVYWKDVPTALRDAYSFLSVLVVRDMFESDPQDIANIIRRADIGILLGSSLFREHLLQLIQDSSSIRDHFDGHNLRTELSREHKRLRWQCPIADMDNPCPSRAIKRSSPTVSLEEFIHDHLNSGIPLLLERSADDWPALRKWKDLQYFRESNHLRIHLDPLF